MQLKEIMTVAVETIAPSASLVEAARKMLLHDVGSLPVCEGRNIVGIITDRDITVRAVASGMDPADVTVREVMTDDVLACVFDCEVEEACRLMEEKQVRRVVVTDKARNLVGIVAMRDIGFQHHDAASRWQTASSIWPV